MVSYGRTGDWSRRTKVYNDANTRYGYGFQSTVLPGQDASTVGVGVRHAF